jgi:VanZ family protein
LVPGYIRWLGVLVVAGFIFYVSLVTVPPEQPVVPGRPDFLPLDKWRHFLAYAALGYALAYAITDWRTARWRKALLVLTVVAVYGGGIELSQSLLPQRYFGVDDFIANQFGAILSLTWYFLEPRVTFMPVRGFWRRYGP